MDATRYHGLARLLSVVLLTILTAAAGLRAEETSTLVFSDPSVSEDTVLDTSPAPTAEKRSALGSLVVVPERKAQPLSQPKRIHVAPAKPLPRPATTLQVERTEKKLPSPESAIELVARPLPRPVPQQAQRPTPQAQRPPETPAAKQVEYVQPASHELPSAEEEVESDADPGAEILVEAHELSLHAAEPQDYDELIALCKSAKRVGIEGDQLAFANTLMAWALNRRGQSRADQGEQSRADVDFEQALKLDPDNWRALHNRGVSYAQAGKFAEALDDLNQVIEFNPLFAKAFANRATLFTQSGDLEVALADYQRACKLDPNLLVAQVGRGRICHQLRRWEEALDAFTKALELNADSPDVVCSRADLFADMGLYAEALADYAAAIDLNPEFAHAYRNGAWLLATCPDSRYRDAANAIGGAERALEFGYGEPHVALDTLAAAQASAGQFEAAVETLEEALKSAPYEARTAYRSRLKLYLAGQPYLTDPPAGVEQAIFEATDR